MNFSICFFKVGETCIRMGGMAKGSGMIHPNMATMLGVCIFWMLLHIVPRTSLMVSWHFRLLQLTLLLTVMFGGRWYSWQLVEVLTKLRLVTTLSSIFRLYFYGVWRDPQLPLTNWVFLCIIPSSKILTDIFIKCGHFMSHMYYICAIREDGLVFFWHHKLNILSFQ